MRPLRLIAALVFIRSFQSLEHCAPANLQSLDVPVPTLGKPVCSPAFRRNLQTRERYRLKPGPPTKKRPENSGRFTTHTNARNFFLRGLPWETENDKTSSTPKRLHPFGTSHGDVMHVAVDFSPRKTRKRKHRRVATIDPFSRRYATNKRKKERRCAVPHPWVETHGCLRTIATR